MAWAQYHVARWTTEEGLPQNSVTAIVQTRDGYLWLGTFGGLVRFDGVRFTILNTGNTPQLKSNRITALFEDRDGSLWIGAETGEIARYRQGEFAAWTGVGGTILSFYQERSGLIWGLRMSARPIRFAPEQPEQAAVVTAAQGLEGERLYSICEDQAGYLWATTRQGVTLWRDGAFRTDHGIEGLPQRGIPRVFPRQDGSLWVVEEKGLGRIRNQRFELLVETTDTMGIPPPPLLKTRGGQTWFGYRENALWHSQGTDGAFQPYYLKEATNNQIRVLLEDREGNLWIGTLGGGLIRLRPRRVTTLSKADGLLGDEIFAISEDAQGNAWVTMPQGLNHIAGGQGTSPTITAWNETEEGRKFGATSTFYRDQTGNFWLGGSNRLAQVRDGRLMVQERPAASGAVRAIVRDQHGALWLGISGQGLARYSNGALTQVYKPSDGLISGNINVLFEDRAGALWIGTEKGLSQFKDERFTNYTTAHGLSNDLVRDLYEDQDGALWIGTYGGGLNRLKDGRIARVTTNQGLFDDFVSRILVDKRDRFWMLGNRGIFYVSRQHLNDVADGRSRSALCNSYGVADGMLSSEGNGPVQPAGWRMRDGRMWFSTIKGIAIVDPREADAPPPPVVIEYATLDGVPIAGRGVIEVAPGQENLELHYTGLHFGKPEQVRFKYKLEGLNADWIDSGTRRTAYYPHLPPGSFTFHVLAANPDGVWSEMSARLKIVVRPPFYRTWWFIVLLVVGVAGLVLFTYKVRVRQLERARIAQEEFSRRLIDAHETERRRIAADLHDSLGQSLAMIKNRAVYGANSITDLPTAKENFERINDEAATVISDVREIAHNLRPYLLDRLGLTKALQAMLRHIEETCAFDLTIQLENVDVLFAPEAEMSIYRIVQECLNNVIKHAAATQVLVSISPVENELEIIIEDNGRGFDLTADNTNSEGERRG
ncbi:MAG: hypothetical protein JNM09_14555, partial [Blastocatellia bacterium]|nr:hypothetical protein [Blastocatellia bacterium]